MLKGLIKLNDSRLSRPHRYVVHPIADVPAGNHFATKRRKNEQLYAADADVATENDRCPTARQPFGDGALFAGTDAVHEGETAESVQEYDCAIGASKFTT